MLEDQPQNPWDRQPGEPSLWWQRFNVYLEMGVNRTLLGAFRKDREENGTKGKRKSHTERKPPNGWIENSQKWKWKERAEAWDENERRRIAEERRGVRDERRRTLEEAEWEDAAALRTEAYRYLEEIAGWRAGKVVTKVHEDEEQPQRRKPKKKQAVVEQDIDAAYGSVVKLLEKASVLARRSIGEPVTHPVAPMQPDSDSEREKMLKQADEMRAYLSTLGDMTDGPGDDVDWDEPIEHPEHSEST